MELDGLTTVITKAVEGSPFIVLLLLGAITILWRELKSERAERIRAVETYANSVQKIASDYSDFSSVLAQLINTMR